MSVRLRWVALVAGLFALLVVHGGPGAAAAVGEVPVGCPPNSSSTATGPYPGCVAGIAVPSVRGYVAGTCILDAKAIDTSNPEYRPGECKGEVDGGAIQAEAIAQARLIAQLNQTGVYGDSAPGGVTPNLQWEPVIPNSSGQKYGDAATAPGTLRPDLLLYDRTATHPTVEVAEIKLQPGVGGAGPVLAASQAAAYVAELQSRGKDAELLDFALPGNTSLGAVAAPPIQMPFE